ncbi:hypothetical protein [Halocatena halophila]|uniref:hypothetical protein n=1 Tax=Halocatena halophila TaxID=2814576 RepID=UPI002ED0F36A
MPRTAATTQNLDLLRPEVVRNQMLETVDQMERIEMGSQEGFASAMSTFPLVNLDDPKEAYYTYDGVTDAMQPVGHDAEAPLMSLDLPSKESITVDSYKEAFNPKRGAETHSSNIPFSTYRRGVTKLNTKIWLTRELIAWRGDSAVDGLIGQWGNTKHPDIPSDHAKAVSNAWSQPSTATPYQDIEDLSFEIVNNGYMTSQQVTPNIWMGPTTLRDLKQTDDMKGRLPNTQFNRVTRDALQTILSEEIANIYTVMVYYPRTNANGEFLDEAGNIVDDADDAALDNILEPYDPSGDVVRRNVVIGRPGAGSAFFPWFLDRLTEDVGPGDVPGEMDVDEQNGFLTYVYKDPPTRNTYVQAEQELGFHIMRGENWGLLSGV